MSSPVLNRVSPFASLSPLQSQVEGLVGGFAEQAADWRSLAAMTAGGLAYRAGRIGLMGLGGGSALRAASVGLGLTAEVSTFEITHRGLSSVFIGARGRAPLHANLWSWNGSGGLAQGLLQSFITFGALKGAGRLAQGENLIAQHLLQDSAMVLGHQTTGALGMAFRPEGTLAEQFLHAEATNLQLGAGMALAHRFAPGLHALDRGLDLSLPEIDGGARSPRSQFGSNGTGAETAPLQIGWEPAWLGPDPGPRETRGGDDKKREGIFLSSSLTKSPGSLRLDPFGLGEPTNLERILQEGKAVPPELLQALIRAVLLTIPSGLSAMELTIEMGQPSHQLVLEGRLRHRRLEALHRLLAGGRDLKEIRVIDNASGNILDLAFSLARLGSSIVVKEPGELESSLHQEILRTLPNREIAERIDLVPEKALDIHTPGDIVFWTNPCLFRLQRPSVASLGEYLGRDVKPGGYLVMQSDHLSGTQTELLRLNLDPAEWETVFDEDIPNFFPRSNYLLPTAQGHNNLHVQVHRRKINTPLVEPLGTGPMETSFPYVEGEHGVLFPRKPGSTVVLLGDVAGTRTYALASKGHRVIHIDRDFAYLDGARNYVGLKFEGALMRGQAPGKLDIAYLHRDWFETSFQADLVEAFYPLDYGDLPQKPGAARNRALRRFMAEALNSKIRPGGTVFMVAEDSILISDLAVLIEQDPRLQLLEERYQERRPAIVGGYGVAGGIRENSWLIYRRK